MKKLMRRLARPHTLVALVALLALGGGSAIAAKKYVVDSKKDIAPKVRKALKGKRGKVGPAGPQGLPGLPGAPGAAGPSNVVFRDFPDRFVVIDEEPVTLGTVTLGAGDWVLETQVNLQQDAGGSGVAGVYCEIRRAGGDDLDYGETLLYADAPQLTQMVSRTVVTAADPVRTYSLRCDVYDEAGATDIGATLDGSLLATRVGAADADFDEEENF